MDMKLDGYVKAGLHKFWLNDANWIRLVIVDTAAGIGMRIVNGPTVHSFKEGNGEPEGGLSAFAIIAESNISIHTWPVEGYVTVDVFSCKDFDPEAAHELLTKMLGIKEVVRYSVDPERGGPPGLAAKPPPVVSVVKS